MWRLQVYGLISLTLLEDKIETWNYCKGYLEQSTLHEAYLFIMLTRVKG